MVNSRLLFALSLIALLFGCSPADKNEDLNKVEVKGKNTVFYTDDITEKQAKRLSKFLEEFGWFDDESKTAVRVEKAEDGYNVSLVVQDGFEKKQHLVRLLWVMQSDMSNEVFDGATTHIVPSDDKLDEMKGVHIEPTGTYKPEEECFIIYNDKIVTKQDAKALAKVLENEGYLKAGGTKRILVSKEDDENIIRILGYQKAFEENPEAFKSFYHRLLTAIKKDVFQGDKTVLYLCSDTNYKDFVRIEDKKANIDAEDAAPPMTIDSLFSSNQSPSKAELKSIRRNTH